MRCRCCPGLDLLPVCCRGQNGTGARATFSLGQAGAALCRMWPVPTLLLCSLFLIIIIINKLSLDSCHRTPLSFWWSSINVLVYFSTLPHAFTYKKRTLLILCHRGVFSSAVSWPGACTLLSLGWVCLVDCSTGTDWHSSWGLQGLHTQSTKHVSVWEAALNMK